MFVQIRLDHKDSTVHFGEDNLDSDNLTDCLASLAKRLSTAQTMIKKGAGRRHRLTAVLNEAREKMEHEHAMALSRKENIEQRKEEQEQLLLEKERAEERKRREQTQQALAAEALRRQQEAEKREQERIQREREEKEMEEAKAMLKRENKRLKPGQKLDKQKIMQEVLTEQLKEQRELDRQLNKMSKRLDHLVRAFREEEKPLVVQSEQDRIEEERVFYGKESEKNAVNHKKAWEIDLVEKARLSKLLTDKEEFADMIRSRRHEEFEIRRRAREKEIAEQKAKRHQARLRQKIVQFTKEARDTIVALVLKEEEERKQLEKEREEENFRRLKEKKEEELRRQAEIIQKREAEMELKKKEQREAALRESDKWTRSSREPYRPAPSTGSGGGGGGGAYQPPSVRARAADYGRDRSPQTWQRRNQTPPRTPPHSRNPATPKQDSRDRDRWNEPTQPPRSPIAAPPRTSAGYVPPDGGSVGFKDSRPPPSSHPDSFYRGSEQKWRPSRETGSDSRSQAFGGSRNPPDSRQGESRSSGGGGGSYVPPHLRKSRDPPPPREDRGSRW